MPNDPPYPWHIILSDGGDYVGEEYAVSERAAKYRVEDLKKFCPRIECRIEKKGESANEPHG